MEKQEIGIYGREKMFMRKKENELQIDWKHFYLGVLALGHSDGTSESDQCGCNGLADGGDGWGA